MAKPTYTDDGELIDGGFDMSTTGVCGYGYRISSLFNTFWLFILFFFSLPPHLHVMLQFDPLCAILYKWLF